MGELDLRSTNSWTSIFWKSYHIKITIQKFLNDWPGQLIKLSMRERESPFVVYFNQLLGAARTRKLVETLLFGCLDHFCSFQTFFSDFLAEIKKNCLEMYEKNSVLSYSLKVVDMKALVDSRYSLKNIFFFCWSAT